MSGVGIVCLSLIIYICTIKIAPYAIIIEDINMTKLNHSLVFIATALLAFSGSSYGESWSCRHDNNVREIHIVQETSSGVPCSVVYKKQTEGVEDQVLWTASNDANYCLEKATAFVEKQTAWGWTCVETIADDNTQVEKATTPEESGTAVEPQP